MKKYILIAAFLAISPALAEEPRSYSLVVTSSELGIMAQALGQRPYNEVAPLLNKLDAQLAEQNKTKPPADSAKPSETPAPEAKAQ